MSSGKHRRAAPEETVPNAAEAAAVPHVNLAERLSSVSPVHLAPPAPAAPPGLSSPVLPAPAPQVAQQTDASPEPLEPPSLHRDGPAHVTPGPTVVVRRDRAGERSVRRRAARRRVLLVAAVVVAVALAGVAVWALLGRGDTGAPTPVATGPARQLTMVVQVTGADGNAEASALVGTTKVGSKAVVLLVPSGLVVQVPGGGDLPFGEAATDADPGLAAASLADLLGVKVSDNWVLTQEGLAALADAVGGVQASVDVDVTSTALDGTTTVLVRAGDQKLSGVSAAAFATYLADGEPEQARLARFDNVLTSLVARLPSEEAAVVDLLAKLGAGSKHTLDTTALAQRLVVMHAAAVKDNIVSDVLPVKTADTGGSAPAYVLDVTQAAATMRTRFPGAQQPSGAEAPLRVLVENGVGTPGLVLAARTKLIEGGFLFQDGGNASSFTKDPTSLLVADATDASRAAGAKVAAALGVPATSVVTQDRGQSKADVIVILGPDFAP